MPKFGVASDYWNAARDVTTEDDYWHLTTDDEAGRIHHTGSAGVPGVGIWHVKPTVDLATRIADALIPLVTDFWDGVFLDESTLNIPTHYWTAYKTADVVGDVVTDADRGYWNAQWNEAVSTFTTRWKNAFGRDRCVIINGAGNEHPKADGTTIEGGHLLPVGTQTTTWAINSFMRQAKFWSENPNRYGKAGVPLNIIWDFPIIAPGLCMLGDNIG